MFVLERSGEKLMIGLRVGMGVRVGEYSSSKGGGGVFFLDGCTLDERGSKQISFVFYIILFFFS